jgi:hypothetical protein
VSCLAVPLCALTLFTSNRDVRLPLHKRDSKEWNSDLTQVAVENLSCYRQTPPNSTNNVQDIHDLHLKLAIAAILFYVGEINTH